jgi:hypothetical protein
VGHLDEATMLPPILLSPMKPICTLFFLREVVA